MLIMNISLRVWYLSVVWVYLITDSYLYHVITISYYVITNSYHVITDSYHVITKSLWSLIHVSIIKSLWLLQYHNYDHCFILVSCDQSVSCDHCFISITYSYQYHVISQYHVITVSYQSLIHISIMWLVSIMWSLFHINHLFISVSCD